ncbi:Adenylyltransferase and sulfurtransferase MOCS3-like [Oopsacas minuta]|uniref:Adenylyltransferase and sulfurtransferase MOCS3 homolog n=1 Tax=Oopsacas minuta TaxID=111878 RepID=A0AAV7JSN3_9METZ|nr:Adenylyltransferase and sulfurtransferase MOCS3-like [Oopsacas minuta]
MASSSSHDLTNSDITRYSRQLILDEFGPSSQSKLKHGSCLIVGVGGLGCPAATYLAAAGIGTLGLVDYDRVDIANLHRQVLYSENGVGQSKVASAKEAMTRLNSNVTVNCYQTILTSDNAIDIARDYDVILDATDNVATRYLLNDLSVLLDRPLVSGSALRFEGQLTVYHYQGGPCYRCLFPAPPPPETVTNCSDGGVLGVVPGVIGSLQALETIKILTGLEVSYSGRLLLYDGLRGSFTTVKLRSRTINCKVCGNNPEITGLVDYVKFCGSKPNDKCLNLSILNEEDRITVELLQRIDKDSFLIVDCRKKVEYDICHLSNSINIPLEELSNAKEPVILLDNIVTDLNKNIFFLCHHGNDSQKAVKLVNDNIFLLKDYKPYRVIKDVIGGIHLWSQLVDPSIPQY